MKRIHQWALKLDSAVELHILKRGILKELDNKSKNTNASNKIVGNYVVDSLILEK